MPVATTSTGHTARHVIICLPEKPDGYELADVVMSKNPQCKVILTSGHGDVLSQGSRFILRKPYEANELLQSVKLVLSAA